MFVLHLHGFWESKLVLSLLCLRCLQALTSDFPLTMAHTVWMVIVVVNTDVTIKHVVLSKPFLLAFREVPGRPETQLWTASHTDPPSTARGLPTRCAPETGGGRLGSGSEALWSTQASGLQAARTGSALVPVSTSLS